MKLSKKAMTEFQQIYREELGEKISDAEANEMGLGLLNFFKLIYKSISKDEDEKLYQNTK